MAGWGAEGVSGYGRRGRCGTLRLPLPTLGPLPLQFKCVTRTESFDHVFLFFFSGVERNLFGPGRIPTRGGVYSPSFSGTSPAPSPVSQSS